MQKPPLALVLGGDLNDAAMIPIGWTKLAQFMNALIHPSQDFAFPTDLLAFRSHAILSVPALAVRFPRHVGIGAYFFQSHIAFFWGHRSMGIIFNSLNMRAGSKHAGQDFGRMG